MNNNKKTQVQVVQDQWNKTWDQNWDRGENAHFKQEEMVDRMRDFRHAQHKQYKAWRKQLQDSRSKGGKGFC